MFKVNTTKIIIIDKWTNRANVSIRSHRHYYVVRRVVFQKYNVATFLIRTFLYHVMLIQVILSPAMLG